MSHGWHKIRRGRRGSDRRAVGPGEQRDGRSDGGGEVGEGRLVFVEDQGKGLVVREGETQGG